MDLLQRALLLLAVPFLAALGSQAGWARAALATGVPAERLHHSMVYDTVGRRLILFGGLQGPFTFNDVWEMPNTSGQWRPIEIEGPLPPTRWGHTAIHDPVRNRMLVFGGFTLDGQRALGDLWELSLGGVPRWREIVPGGSRPSPRFAHAAIYDSRSDRMIVYGGYDGQFLGDMWQLPLAGTPSWFPLFQAGPFPSPRDGHVAVYDAVADRMIVHGGFDGTSSLDDVWAFSFGILAWSGIVAGGEPPAARRQHAAAFDAARHRLLVFGGTQTGNDPGFGDLWSLPLGDSPAWQRLEPAGSAPAGRWGATLTSVGRDQLVLFGGVNLEAWLNDTWLLRTEPKVRWALREPDD